MLSALLLSTAIAASVPQDVSCTAALALPLRQGELSPCPGVFLTNSKAQEVLGWKVKSMKWHDWTAIITGLTSASLLIYDHTKKK